MDYIVMGEYDAASQNDPVAIIGKTALQFWRLIDW